MIEVIVVMIRTELVVLFAIGFVVSASPAQGKYDPIAGKWTSRESTVKDLVSLEIEIGADGECKFSVVVRDKSGKNLLTVGTAKIKSIPGKGEKGGARRVMVGLLDKEWTLKGSGDLQTQTLTEYAPFAPRLATITLVKNKMKK